MVEVVVGGHWSGADIGAPAALTLLPPHPCAHAPTPRHYASAAGVASAFVLSLAVAFAAFADFAVLALAVPVLPRVLERRRVERRRVVVLAFFSSAAGALAAPSA